MSQATKFTENEEIVSNANFNLLAQQEKVTIDFLRKQNAEQLKRIQILEANIRTTPQEKQKDEHEESFSKKEREMNAQVDQIQAQLQAETTSEMAMTPDSEFIHK